MADEKITGKKILVTGASGTVGRAVTERLAKDNEVLALDLFTGDRNIQERLDQQGIKTLRKNLLDESYDDIPKDFDYIYYEAVVWGRKGIPREVLMGVNSFAPGRLMRHCREKCRGFVYASTGGLYPPGPDICQEENWPVTEAEAYHTSKYAGEVVVEYSSRIYQVPAMITRYFFPYSTEGGMVQKWMIRQLTNEPRNLCGDENVPVMPVYIEDAIRMTIQAAPKATVPATIVNVASSEARGKRDLVHVIAKLIDRPIKWGETDKPHKRWVADTTRMHEIFGPTRYTVEQGLQEVADAILPQYPREKYFPGE